MNNMLDDQLDALIKSEGLLPIVESLEKLCKQRAETTEWQEPESRKQWLTCADGFRLIIDYLDNIT